MELRAASCSTRRTLPISRPWRTSTINWSLTNSSTPMARPPTSQPPSLTTSSKTKSSETPTDSINKRNYTEYSTISEEHRSPTFTSPTFTTLQTNRTCRSTRRYRFCSRKYSFTWRHISTTSRLPSTPPASSLPATGLAATYRHQLARTRGRVLLKSKTCSALPLTNFFNLLSIYTSLSRRIWRVAITWRKWRFSASPSRLAPRSTSSKTSTEE